MILQINLLFFCSIFFFLVIRIGKIKESLVEEVGNKIVQKIMSKNVLYDKELMIR